MPLRKITCIKRDRSGNVVALGNKIENWSPKYIDEIINDIESGRFSYYVNNNTGFEFITVIAINGSKFLQTVPDKKAMNHLDNIIEC